MRRALSMICALALMLGMIVPWSGHVHAAGESVCTACGATVAEWISLTSGTTLAPGNHYYLASSVERGVIALDTAGEAGTYCLDLAGYTLSNPSNRAIVLGKSSGDVAVTFNIMDSSTNKTGRVEGFFGKTDYSAGVIYLYKGTTMNIYGGTFTSTKPTEASAKYGGVFQVSSGSTVNMYGGSIIGGTATNDGGAVNLAGTLNMSGGSISGGTAATGNCVYASSSSKIKLSNNAGIEEIYFGSTPSNSLTISGTYTGTVALNGATAIASGDTVAVSDNADISGATISIVGDAALSPSVSGTNIVVGKLLWCEACEDYVAWQSLDGVLPNAAGHYKLTKNVSAGQVTLDAIGGAICLDLAGYKYTGTGRAFLLKDVSGDTIKDTVNIMDSSDGNAGAMQAKGGSNAHAGGIFRTYSNTILNVYDANLEYLTHDEVKTKNGAVAIVEGIMNVYGSSKLVGGKVATTGGTIDVLSAGTLNLYGGEIFSGEAGTVGDCVHVTSGGTVNLSGDASVEEIYFAGSSASKLTVTGNYTGKTALKFATTPAANADIGNCTDAVIGKECIAITGTRLFAAVSGTNLVTTALQGASVTSGDSVTYYDTLAQAVAGYTAGTVKLLADNSEAVALPGGMRLDLNGWDLSGDVTVSSGKVSVMDTATDDYDVDDVAGYGKVPVTLKDYAEPVENYLEIEEDTGVSFHRCVLKLSKVNLRPGTTGLYYTADIKLSSAVLNKVDSYGIAVSTGSKKPALEDEKTLYTAIAAADYTSGGTNSVLINAVMDPAAQADTNTVYATTVIYGRPYVKFKDGAMVPFYGDVCATSLQQLTEAVEEKAWDRLTLAQSRGLTAMYEAYEDVTAAWNLPSVENANAAATDNDLKVLIIGNSHGLDSTHLLREVFKAEGYITEEQNVVLGALYTGGCRVSKHASNLKNNYSYEYYVRNDGTNADGTWEKTYNATMLDALQDDNWDVVLLQEMNTISGFPETASDFPFNNDNIETVYTHVVRTLGYEPKLMWNMVWANPEIPEDYLAIALGEESDDGTYVDPDEVTGDTPTETTDEYDAACATWIFGPTNPLASRISWCKNYNNYFQNNRKTMYEGILSNLQNYVIGNSALGISENDVMPAATAVQYALEYCGMTENGSAHMGDSTTGMYRDYTHMSDFGRVLVSYLWYAKLTGKTEITDVNFTTVPKVMRQSKFTTQGELVLTEDQIQAIKDAVNYALENPYTMPVS